MCMASHVSHWSILEVHWEELWPPTQAKVPLDAWRGVWHLSNVFDLLLLSLFGSDRNTHTYMCVCWSLSNTCEENQDLSLTLTHSWVLWWEKIDQTRVFRSVLAQLSLSLSSLGSEHKHTHSVCLFILFWSSILRSIEVLF